MGWGEEVGMQVDAGCELVSGEDWMRGWGEESIGRCELASVESSLYAGGG